MSIEVMKLDFPIIYTGYFINNCKDNLTEEEIKDADSIINNLKKRHIIIVGTDDSDIESYKIGGWKIGDKYYQLRMCTYICHREVKSRKKKK